MNKGWHTLTVGKDASGEFIAETAIDPDSFWFNGHFPGMPILPGIAQLAMIGETLALSGVSRPITRFSKVRFRQLIRPGDAIRFSITPDAEKPGSYRFKATANGRAAITGVLETEHK